MLCEQAKRACVGTCSAAQITHAGKHYKLLRNALYVVPAILISLTFHEFGHAYAAYKMGDPTARNLGRMTLNPLAHIDPIGFILLVLFGFGWAKPVPVNPRNYKTSRKEKLLFPLRV